MCQWPESALGEQGGFLVRECENVLVDFGCHFEEIESLGNASTGDTKVFGYVCFRGNSCCPEQLAHGKRLFDGIEWRLALRLKALTKPLHRGFKSEYEKAVVLNAGNICKELDI